MKKQINIIDLFAGPGGLGEGFSGYQNPKKNYPFKIRMSVEKEESAHKTLQLRAFFRQFRGKKLPPEYYEYIKNPQKLNKHKLEKFKNQLFEKYWKESTTAIKETLGGPQTLGNEDSDRLIQSKLSKLLKKHDGEDFIVIGGPPCQAYSNAGKSRMAGIEDYKIEEDERAELYLEFLKVIHKVNPKVFVMENVKGILSAKLHDELVFPRIIRDLKNPGKVINNRTKSKYHIYSLVKSPDSYDDNGEPIYNDLRSFTIHAEEHGVPQNRHRVILLGVRDDVEYEPGTLQEDLNKTSIKSILDGLPVLRSGISKAGGDKSEKWYAKINKAGKALVTALNTTNSKKHAKNIKEHIKKISPNLNRGGRFVASKKSGFLPSFNKPLKSWLYDPQLGGFPNHETKEHMYDDLKRYLWISTYGELNRVSPKSRDFPGFLAPNHKNWESGDHADRFKVQIKNKPSSTITCHLSKDGHASIHYDPKQCRSFTVREAARIQTFPDNYFFEGTKTEQYVQVGNAVPPYLANQIAEIVYDVLS